ncbi:MAG: hypothetical protein V4731_04855 [Pseudomonadota bacterium]
MAKTPTTADYAPDIRGMDLSIKGPLIKEGALLSAQVEARDSANRPMVWRDLPMFATKYHRTAVDMMYDLGLNTPYFYQQAVKSHGVVPFDLELLVRIYDRSPSSCDWDRPTVREIFETLYGQTVQGFGEELSAKAHMAYGARFARLLGRATTVLYRWLIDESGTTRRIGNIISKLQTAAQQGQDARREFETLAIAIWANRGYDVDKAYPSYTPETIEVKHIRKSSVRPAIVKRMAGKEEKYPGGTF